MSDWIIDAGERVLVTGANGFIGSRVVSVLLEYGFTNIRCLVRQSSALDGLEAVVSQHGATNSVEIVRGDLLSREACERAARDVRVVYHLAAGIEKSFAGAFMNSAVATRNLVEAFLTVGRPARFVNVSSFAVYSNSELPPGAPLDEGAPLEDRPHERWDAYGYGKLKQEEVVRRYGRERGLRYVVLRPGTVFGPGKPALSGRVGVGTFGIFMHIGGRNVLPLTYVDNCAEAVVRAGLVPGVDGETFNVVDDAPVTSVQFLRAYKRVRPGFRSIRVPYRAAWLLSCAWEAYSRKSRHQLPPVFNRRRCSAEWKGNRYPNEKIKHRLGWRPRVSMQQGLSRFLEQFEAGR